MSCLSDYNQKRQLGQGSYGQVYLVERKVDGLQMVLKQVQATEEELNEASIMSRLDHTNIIKCFGSFRDEFYAYLVLEFADRGDLEQMLHQTKEKNKIFSIVSVMNVFLQLCAGLGYIHENRIIHRDIKTGNAFLCYPLVVKLGDFGTSKKLTDSTQMAQTCIGTPYYMAPELFDSDRYTNKVDIWSLGCILYEMLSLRRPFEGNNILSLTMKIMSGKYPALPSWVPPDMRAIVAKMLDKNPATRPSIQQIVKDPFITQAIQNFKMSSKETVEEGGDPSNLEVTIQNAIIQQREKLVTPKTHKTNLDRQRDIEQFADKRIDRNIREERRRMLEELRLKKVREEESKKHLENEKKVEQRQYMQKKREERAQALELEKEHEKEYRKKLSAVKPTINAKELRKHVKKSDWSVDIACFDSASKSSVTPDSASPEPEFKEDSKPKKLAPVLSQPASLPQKPILSSSRRVPKSKIASVGSVALPSAAALAPPPPPLLLQSHPSKSTSDSMTDSNLMEAEDDLDSLSLPASEKELFTTEHYLAERQTLVEDAISKLGESTEDIIEDVDSPMVCAQNALKQKELCLHFFAPDLFDSLVSYVREQSQIGGDLEMLPMMVAPQQQKGLKHLLSFIYLQGILSDDNPM